MDLYEKNATKADFGNDTPSMGTLPAASAGFIDQGEAIFNQAYDKAGGSLAGTASVASSIVNDLPPGSATQALSQALSIGEGAISGAVAGSIFPGIGTAVGAVVGAGLALISQIAAGNPANPQGEFRSTAEQWCFPAMPLTSGFPLANPGTYPDIRINIVEFQAIHPDGTTWPPDPASGQGSQSTFTFGVGWVSPPQSTPASKAAAWSIANAWFGQNGATKELAMSTGNYAAKKAVIAANIVLAQKNFLGNVEQYNRAMALMNECLGSPPIRAFHLQTDSYIDAIGYVNNVGSGNAAVAEFVHEITKLNKQIAEDYTYYISKVATWFRMQGENATPPETISITEAGEPQAAVASDLHFNPIRVLACPDTISVGIAEIVYLYVTGALPGVDDAGFYVIVFHFVMSQAWLFRWGQKYDNKESGGNPPFHTIENHPNFSRIIGIVSRKIRNGRPIATMPAAPASSVGAETDVHAIDVGAIMQAQDKADNAVPWGFMYAAFIGIFIGYKVLKEMDKDKIDVD